MLGDSFQFRRITGPLQVNGPSRLLVGHAHAHHLLDQLVVHIVLDALLGPVLLRPPLLALLHRRLSLLYETAVEGIDVPAGLPAAFLEALLKTVLFLQGPRDFQGALPIVLDSFFLDAGHILMKADPIPLLETVSCLPGLGPCGAHATQLGLDLGSHLLLPCVQGLALEFGPFIGVLHPGPLGGVLAEDGGSGLGGIALLDALDDGGGDLDALNDHVRLVGRVHALLNHTVARGSCGLGRPVSARRAPDGYVGIDIHSAFDGHIAVGINPTPGGRVDVGIRSSPDGHIAVGINTAPGGWIDVGIRPTPDRHIGLAIDTAPGGRIGVGINGGPSSGIGIATGIGIRPTPGRHIGLGINTSPDRRISVGIDGRPPPSLATGIGIRPTPGRHVGLAIDTAPGGRIGVGIDGRLPPGIGIATGIGIRPALGRHITFAINTSPNGRISVGIGCRPPPGLDIAIGIRTTPGCRVGIVRRRPPAVRPPLSLFAGARPGCLPVRSTDALCGVGVGLIDKVRPLADLVRRVVDPAPFAFPALAGLIAKLVLPVLVGAALGRLFNGVGHVAPRFLNVLGATLRLVLGHPEIGLSFVHPLLELFLLHGLGFSKPDDTNLVGAFVVAQGIGLPCEGRGVPDVLGSLAEAFAHGLHVHAVAGMLKLLLVIQGVPQGIRDGLGARDAHALLAAGRDKGVGIRLPGFLPFGRGRFPDGGVVHLADVFARFRVIGDGVVTVSAPLVHELPGRLVGLGREVEIRPHVLGRLEILRLLSLTRGGIGLGVGKSGS